MRSSEKQKLIDSDPKYKLFDLKRTKGTGKVAECKSGKLWIYHKVVKGIDHYKIYNLKDKVIHRGVAK